MLRNCSVVKWEVLSFLHIGKLGEEFFLGFFAFIGLCFLSLGSIGFPSLRQNLFAAPDKAMSAIS